MNSSKKRVVALLAALMLAVTLLCGGMVVSADETVEATALDLNLEELLMLPGATQTLKPQILPEEVKDMAVTWSSDNEAVAIMSGASVVAVAEGTATVTAVLPNGLKDTCKVTVVSGKQVLKNSTFDGEAAAAWVLNGVTVLPSGGCNDSAYAEIVYQSTLAQKLENLEPATTYEVVLNAKMTADAKVKVSLMGDGTEFSNSELSLGKSWGTRRFEFTTPDTLPATAELFFNGPETAELTYSIDNVVVAKKVADADLVVESLDWDGGDGQVKPGTKLTFKAEIANVGKADVTEPFTVDIAFGTEVILTLKHEGGVKAGEKVTVTSEPWEAVEGDKMISATVNPDLAIEESNYTTNNTRQINLRVAKDRLAPAYNAEEVAGAGMFDLTFNDDFDDLSSVDTLASGGVGYKWYVSRQWKQTDMTREDYFVKDGVFTLEHLDSTYAIGASTVDADTHTGYSYNKGYMEVKLRIPEPVKNEGVRNYPAIWSLSPGKWCGIPGQNERWVEMDWLEYYGRENGYYTVTMHELDYTTADGSPNQYTSTDNERYGLNDKEWHVMGFLWEDDHLRCYLDGELLREQRWGADILPQPMHRNVEGEIRLEGVFDIFDTQDCVLHIAGPRGMPLELDYLRVWQLGGDEPAEDAPEAEDSPATGAVPGVCAVVTALAAAATVFTRKKK